VTRVCIGQALVDSCSLLEAQSAIIAHASSDGDPAYVSTPNAQHIVLLNKDKKLRQIYREADLVVPDGISLLMAARLFGRVLPERVTGVDLFQSLCVAAAAANLKLFFLGGLPGSADLAAMHLRAICPGIDIQTYCPPLGFENDQLELARIAAIIRISQPRILFVGLGAPKQDYWIYDHGRDLGVKVCMGIGGSFEMVSGIVKRAPHWVQLFGCEWLYRLLVEPRRLWRRYLVGNPQFVRIVLSQRITRVLVEALLHLLRKSRFESAIADTEAWAKAIETLSQIEPSTPKEDTGTSMDDFREKHVKQ
jgi:N-acetylglucosaminyldiphosphoundecaprenol N-acetyl-beta-D-mannosaminyltransferase